MYTHTQTTTTWTKESKKHREKYNKVISYQIKKKKKKRGKNGINKTPALALTRSKQHRIVYKFEAIAHAKVECLLRLQVCFDSCHAVPLSFLLTLKYALVHHVPCASKMVLQLQLDSQQTVLHKLRIKNKDPKS